MEEATIISSDFLNAINKEMPHDVLFLPRGTSIKINKQVKNFTSFADAFIYCWNNNIKMTITYQ